MAVLQSSVVELLYSARWHIALILAVWWAWQTYSSYHRLSHIKGPWLAHWSQLWLIGAVNRQNVHIELYLMCKKYGPLFRIGPNLLATSDVEQIMRMNSPRSGYTRSEWYYGFRLAPGVDNIFSMRDTKEHATRKLQMNMGYTGKENIDFEPTVDKHVGNFINLIRKKYISSESNVRLMDLSEKINFFTMDVIVDLAMGAPFGNLIHDKDMHGYLKIMSDMGPIFSLLAVLPYEFTRILQIPAIGYWVFPSSRDELGLGKLISIAEKQVAERFSPSQEKRENADIVQSFINHGLNEHETVYEALLLVLGGSDSTATAIRVIMLHIMTNPYIYNKLRAEIDGAIIAGKISSPVVRDAEARALPYLQAVIMESLRICPPAGGLLSKVTPPEGDTVCGVFVPGGVEFTGITWAALRNENIFGQQPDLFRPERWLDVPEEKFKEMARVTDLAFGHGMYKCLGRTVALMELNKISVELFRHFEWAVADPGRPWTQFNTGFILQRDFHVRVMERREVEAKA